MSGLSYRAAGVDIAKKSTLLEGIGAMVAKTFQEGVLHDLGAFGGMYRGTFPGYEDPVLVASNDGVGTKVRTGVRAGRVRARRCYSRHCAQSTMICRNLSMGGLPGSDVNPMPQKAGQIHSLLLSSFRHKHATLSSRRNSPDVGDSAKVRLKRLVCPPVSGGLSITASPGGL